MEDTGGFKQVGGLRENGHITMTTAWERWGMEDRIKIDCRNLGENGGGLSRDCVRAGNQGERFRRYSISPCSPLQDLGMDWKLGARESFVRDTDKFCFGHVELEVSVPMSCKQMALRI